MAHGKDYGLNQVGSYPPRHASSESTTLPTATLAALLEGNVNRLGSLIDDLRVFQNNLAGTPADDTAAPIAGYADINMAGILGKSAESAQTIARQIDVLRSIVGQLMRL